MKKELSILLPIYNEEAILERNFDIVYKFLEDNGYIFDFIIVDDASSDNSQDIALRLQDEYTCVRYLRHDSNQGPCSGLKSGCGLARMKWLLLLPADLAIPLEDINTLWEKREGSDILVGYIKDKKTRSISRRFQSRTYAVLVNLLFGTNLRQINYVSLYNTAIFTNMKLTSSGVALHAEILIRAKLNGFRIGHVGLGFQRRDAGQASGNKPTVIWKTIAELAKLRLII